MQQKKSNEKRVWKKHYWDLGKDVQNDLLDKTIRIEFYWQDSNFFSHFSDILRILDFNSRMCLKVKKIFHHLNLEQYFKEYFCVPFFFFRHTRSIKLRFKTYHKGQMFINDFKVHF